MDRLSSWQVDPGRTQNPSGGLRLLTAAVCLSPGRRSSGTSLQWQRPDRLLITEDVNGGGSNCTLTVSSGEIETLWQGDEQLHVAGTSRIFQSRLTAKPAPVSAAPGRLRQKSGLAPSAIGSPSHT